MNRLSPPSAVVRHTLSEWWSLALLLSWAAAGLLALLKLPSVFNPYAVAPAVAQPAALLWRLAFPFIPAIPLVVAAARLERIGRQAICPSCFHPLLIDAAHDDKLLCTECGASASRAEHEQLFGPPHTEPAFLWPSVIFTSAPLSRTAAPPTIAPLAPALASRTPTLNKPAGSNTPARQVAPSAAA